MAIELFGTNAGIVRRRRRQAEVLDVSVRSLGEAIRAGLVPALAQAAATTEVRLEDLEMEPVLETPLRAVIVGLNYRSHAEEVGQAVPEQLMALPAQADGALAGPGSPIRLPADAPDQVDYEGEIAIVIGAPVDSVGPQVAWGAVAGLTAANDVTARDVQAANFEKFDFTSAKLFPTFKPLGPGLLIIDDPRELDDLQIVVTVNGEERQRGIRSDLVFGLPEIVSLVSHQLPLEPGDVILTGSPAGVGMSTGRFLRPGDVIEVCLGPLPPLRSEVVAP